MKRSKKVETMFGSRFGRPTRWVQSRRWVPIRWDTGQEDSVRLSVRETLDGVGVRMAHEFTITGRIRARDPRA